MMVDLKGLSGFEVVLSVDGLEVVLRWFED